MPTHVVLIAASFLAILAALYLLVAARRTAASVLLALGFAACGAQNIFDFLCLTDPAGLAFWKRGTQIAEALLPVCFGWAGALTGSRFKSLPVSLRVLLLSLPMLLIPALVYPPPRLMLNPDFAEERLLFLTQAGYLYYLALLAFLTSALVLQERAFARLKRLDRWHLKFEYLGIGTLLAVQVLYYSQGLLYRSLDMSLVPVRSLALIAGLLLFAYSRYRRGYPEKLGLSHEVAFRSVVVLAVGIYLLGLGLIGEGMRYFGADFDRTLFMLLAMLSGIAMMILVLSEQLRRRTAVWLHKHFFRQKYDYRAHWLEFTRRLGLAREPADLNQVILEFYCQSFGLRGGVLYLTLDEQSDFLPTAACETPQPTRGVERDGALGQFLRERRWVFNRDDTGVDEILAATPDLFASARMHFVVPLFFNDRLGGLIALGAPINTGESITYEDYDLMKALAAQAAAALHGQQLLIQLAATHEMAAIGKVSAFIMHDLKNAVSNLALVVDNARDYMDDPEFQRDMLETLGSSVERMRGLIERLKDFESQQQLDCESCDLLQLVESAVADLPEGAILLQGEPVYVSVDRGEISRVVLNLVLNALDATAGTDPVQLLVGRDERAWIRCIDQGEGMTPDFIRQRLFRPFETTKTRGFGIGLYQCQQIVSAHGGRIEVRSEPGQGSEFTVSLPLDRSVETSAAVSEPAGKVYHENEVVWKSS